MEEKECTKCWLLKKVGEFYKNKNKKNGISDYCKKCDSEFARVNRIKNSNKLRKIEGCKTCGYCNLEKDATEFIKNKNNRQGIGNICKECQKNKSKEFRKTEEGKKYGREYQKEFRKNNQEKVKKRYTEYRKNNSDKIKKSREKRKDSLKEYSKNYREINKDEISRKSKIYYQNNKQKRNEYNRIYSQTRRNKNKLFRLTSSVRSRLSEFLKSKNMSKTNKTFDIVGCTPKLLKEHLEKQFKEGMTWENYGFYGWHIDHIIPLSSAENENELYKLFHYMNLQPLWAEENLTKSDKII